MKEFKKQSPESTKFHLINLVKDITSGLLLFLFLYTGGSKLMDYTAFRSTLEMSPVMKPFAVHIAWLIPVVEIVISVMLFIPAFRLTGLKASLVLLTAFTIYIGWMILFASKLPCSCGGIIQSLSWNQHVIFNLFFMILTIIAIYLHYKGTRKAIEGPP